MAPLFASIVIGLLAADDGPPGGITWRDARGYVAPRLGAPIRVDGRLDADEWGDVAWTGEFLDIEGDVKPRPRFSTRAKMAWDDEFFYVAADMIEPHVWGTLTDHDSVIFRDNDFEVFIDPDGDNHEYYEFEINALNTGWDLRLPKPYRDGGPALNDWEIPGLRTGVAIRGTLNDARDEDGGWSVELAFPWKVLAEFAHTPAPPSDGDRWRVNFSRVEWEVRIEDGKYVKVPDKREDNWVWSPQGVIDMHRPERWGYVQFSTRPPGETPPFQPDPTAAARDVLLRLYDAQKVHRQAKGAWALSIDELGVVLTAEERAFAPRIEPKGEGFVARVEVGGERLTMGEDSRVLRDSASPAAPER